MSFIGIKNLGLWRAIILFIVLVVYNLGSVSNSYSLERLAAERLIKNISEKVNGVISSSSSQEEVIIELEEIFKKYADTDIMSLTSLGPARRRASEVQLDNFKSAFQRYFLNKYARRFRELQDGEISILSSRSVRSIVEVKTRIRLIDWAPFEVVWLVSDRSGEIKIFNIIIDGINLLSSERTEIGVMLENRNGDIDLLSRDLRKLYH
jgi:phospholipid transport system substrate-binding protein